VYNANAQYAGIWQGREMKVGPKQKTPDKHARSVALARWRQAPSEAASEATWATQIKRNKNTKFFGYITALSAGHKKDKKTCTN
jgi:hypothetical protein